MDAWTAWCKENGVPEHRIIQGIHRFHIAYPEYDRRVEWRGTPVWHTLSYEGTPGLADCHVFAVAYFHNGQQYVGAVGAGEDENGSLQRALTRLQPAIDAWLSAPVPVAAYPPHSAAHAVASHAPPSPVAAPQVAASAVVPPTAPAAAEWQLSPGSPAATLLR